MNLFKCTGVDSGSGGGGSWDYSTTERLIGTWIDGKPLYEITLDLTMPSADNTYTVIHTFDSTVIDTLLISWGMCYMNTSPVGWINVPMSTSSHIGIVSVGTNGYTIQGYAHGNYRGKRVLVCCRYTKLSD